MRIVKEVMVGNARAVLFQDGTVMYAGAVYPNGEGCNLTVLKALRG